MTATNTNPEFDSLLADIFTTALEGGINYWASVDQYRWTHVNGEQDTLGFRAVINDDEGDGKKYIIDRAHMLRGYELARSTDKVCWSASDNLPDPTDLEAIEDFDYDAGDADAIVQLGLFGEVVYG